jgi:hypothetical protein
MFCTSMTPSGNDTMVAAVFASPSGTTAMQISRRAPARYVTAAPSASHPALRERARLSPFAPPPGDRSG